MARSSYAVRLYEPELADACARFVRRTWPRAEDEPSARADGAEGPPPRVLFLKEGEVIGHVATAPVRLAVNGRVVDAAWAVGLMVLPEHRNGPVAPLVVKKLNEAVSLGLTLHVEEAALRVFKGVGWHHLGVLPQYVRVLDAPAFTRTFARGGRRFLPARAARFEPALRLLSGPLSGLVAAGFTAHAALGALRHRPLPDADLVEERGFDSSYTDLGQRVKDTLGVWVLRDQEYLTQRYGQRMAPYRLLACRRGGRLLGYAILKMRQFADDPRMGQVRLATLVDCVFEPDAVGVLDALLLAAVRRARHERADVLLCTASLRALRDGLCRHGFLPMAGTLNVAFHDRTGALADPPPLEAWHLMRGDSDADANC